MRRSFGLILLLALLGAGLLAGGSFAVQRQGDQVVITAETLAGDPSAAEGLRVSLPLVRGNCLHWNISFPADHPKQTVTEFSYATQEPSVPAFRDVPYLHLPFNYYAVTYYDGSWNDDLSSWDAMLTEASAQVEAGTERTISVLPAQYHTCWPLSVHALTAYEQPLQDTLAQMLASYFTIPIPEDYEVSLTIAKDDTGDISSLTVSSDPRYQYQAEGWSADTPQGLLFTFCNYYEDFENAQQIRLMDGSSIPGGWGIYRLTVDEARGRGSVEAVYTLPEGSQILDFRGVDDSSAFFLLTREADILRLRVFDSQPALQTTIDLFSMKEGERYIQLYQGDDFLIPMLYGDDSGSWRLAVVASGSQGWQLDFTADLEEQIALGCHYLTDAALSMDYQDGRLAIRGAHQRPGFYLAVYSQAGLEYLGVCATSLAPPAVQDTIADYEGQGYYALAQGSPLPLVDWSETAS